MDGMASTPAPYCGAAPSPSEWLRLWNFDPWLVAALALAAGFALTRPAPAHRLRLGLAVGVLALLFLSPLCALGSALFSARTGHHLLVTGLAAPLLAWGAARLRSGHLVLATLAHQTVFWAWHAPDAYDAALSNTALYWAMQLSILASAVWFWMQVRCASAAAAIGALLAAMVGMGLLGALLTFAPAPLYAAHALGPLLWGVSPLTDQQAAGLIMWAPGSAIYLAAALLRLGGLLGPAARTRLA